MDSHKHLDPFFTDGEPELRSVEGGGLVVRGYWAKFNARSRVMTTKKGVKFTESIAPGAFDNTDFSDVECCYNHDERQFLASDPTLRHGVDSVGAWYEFDQDSTDPIHQTVVRRIQRRNVKGASFQFPALPADCYEVRDENGIKHRIITRFPRVVEFGPVRTPAYPDTTTFARSLDGAYEAELNPTPAQKEAGNYKKGRVMLHGMPVAVENPIGSFRSGTAPDGTAWKTKMEAHYGYFSGSDAADGDNVDVFFTDDAEYATMAWVVDQVNLDGSFDEHKCIIGPDYEYSARMLYLKHYAAGWRGLGAIIPVPMECFRSWIMDGKTKSTPLSYVKPAEPTAREIQLRQFNALHP